MSDATDTGVRPLSLVSGSLRPIEDRNQSRGRLQLGDDEPISARVHVVVWMIVGFVEAKIRHDNAPVGDSERARLPQRG